jgi:predicted transcriptional regulator
LANAPIDDEEETDEERAAVAEGRADIEAGKFVTLEELRRELGLG